MPPINSSGWTLCPSKKFAGKFYYFNVATGEAVWSFTDSKINVSNKHPNEHKSYPEPSYPPEDIIINTSNNIAFINKNNRKITQPCLNRSSNFISAPVTTTSRGFQFSHSNTNKYIPDVDSFNTNYEMNPFDYSPSNTKNHYSTNRTEYAMPSCSINYATPNEPTEFPIHSNPTNFSTPKNLIHIATPNNPADASPKPTVATGCQNSLTNSCTVELSNALASKLPSLQLTIPSSLQPPVNIPQYIWLPIPIEYVDDESEKLNNCNYTHNSSSNIQINLNTEATEPKIIRKIIIIPEMESKISCKDAVSPMTNLFQSDKEDNSSENDLRTELKRKLEKKYNDDKSVAEKKIRSDLRIPPVTPKKKVTFNLDLNDENSFH